MTFKLRTRELEYEKFRANGLAGDETLEAFVDAVWLPTMPAQALQVQEVRGIGTIFDGITGEVLGPSGRQNAKPKPLHEVICKPVPPGATDNLHITSLSIFPFCLHPLSVAASAHCEWWVPREV